LNFLNDKNVVFITGINGLVGSFLAKYFLSKGEKVAGLVRSNADLSLLKDVQNQIEWYEGDVLDVLSLEEPVRKADKIIHAAAIVSFAEKDKDLMFKVNVEGTANVVNTCLSAGGKYLCFISSVAALGRKIPTNPTSFDEAITIDENQQWVDSPLNSNYAKTKYHAELEVWRGIAEGLRAFIVNPSVILGEADWSKSSTQLFKYIYDEKKFYPEGSLNYIDVKDLAKIVYQLFDNQIDNERFVLSTAVIQYKDFFDLIAKNFDRKAPSIRISSGISNILWRIEALRSWFTRKAPLITKETALSSSLHFYYSNKKIKQFLQFEFNTLESTIQRICANLPK
jgi:dihydroflavonol-4-reductase